MRGARGKRRWAHGVRLKDPVDQIGLVGAGRVVGVDHCRLDVCVAHPCLQRPQRNPRRRAASTECVAKVAEANLTDAGPLQCSLEALADLSALERMAGMGVAEHKIVLGLVGRSLEQELKLTANAVGHRHGPGRESRLRRAELAADVRAHNSNLLRGPVNVPPTQPEQFALAQPGHRGGEVEGAIHAPKAILENRL
jgi:hypothetical protein